MDTGFLLQLLGSAKARLQDQLSLGRIGNSDGSSDTLPADEAVTRAGRALQETPGLVHWVLVCQRHRQDHHVMDDCFPSWFFRGENASVFAPFSNSVRMLPVSHQDKETCMAAFMILRSHAIRQVGDLRVRRSASC